MSSVADIPIDERASRLRALAAEIPLLAALPEPVRQRLLNASRIERFSPRDALISNGQAPSHLHVILSGIVDLCCTYGSHECTALVMAAGDVFMPAAALHAEPYLVSAQAVTASRILMIDAGVVRQEALDCVPLGGGLARLHPRPNRGAQ